MRRLSATIGVTVALLFPASASAHNTFWSYGPVGGHDGTLTCDEARYVTVAGLGHSGGNWVTECASRINATAWNVRALNPTTYLKCVADQDSVGSGQVVFYVTCRHG